MFGPAIRGGTASVLGDPDQLQTHTYLPDIWEALAVLGSHPDAVGQVWHLPNDPVTRPTRALVDIVHRLAGRSGARLRGTPPWALRLAGPLNPGAR